MTPKEQTKVTNALAAIHRDISVVINMIGNPENIDVQILCDDLTTLELRALEVLRLVDRTLTPAAKVPR